MNQEAFQKKLALAKARHEAKIARLDAESKRRRRIVADVAEGLRLGLFSPDEALKKAFEWAGPLTLHEISWGFLNCNLGLYGKGMLKLRPVEVERLDDSPGGNGIHKETAYLWRD